MNGLQACIHNLVIASLFLKSLVVTSIVDFRFKSVDKSEWIEFESNSDCK